jgi:hypothetical protein
VDVSGVTVCICRRHERNQQGHRDNWAADNIHRNGAGAVSWQRSQSTRQSLSCTGSRASTAFTVTIQRKVGHLLE